MVFVEVSVNPHNFILKFCAQYLRVELVEITLFAISRIPNSISILEKRNYILLAHFCPQFRRPHFPSGLQSASFWRSSFEPPLYLLQPHIGNICHMPNFSAKLFRLDNVLKNSIQNRSKSSQFWVIFEVEPHSEEFFREVSSAAVIM